jgi:hypothetical protein
MHLVTTCAEEVLHHKAGSGRVNYCWSSPAESFLFPCPAELMTILLCLMTLEVVQLPTPWLYIYVVYIDSDI